jgi:toxin ParE1/3/4
VSQLVFSDAVDAALTNIYRYTEETWNQKQADKYVGELLAACDRIAAGKVVKRAIPADFSVPGFVTRQESHFIYWRPLSDGRTGITAILHVSMLQGERLREAFRA